MALDQDEAASTGTAGSLSTLEQPSNSEQKGAGPDCLVCAAGLHDAAPYYQRIKICKACMSSGEVEFGGKRQRFCQQCSRLHPIDRFDGTLRSCREQLARHAERRRLLRKARKEQQHVQAQQAEAGQALPPWQLWPPDNDAATKRRRLDPLPPFPACPPATFGALPPLPMFGDLPAQFPNNDSMLLSSNTAFNGSLSLLPPFHSGPLPSMASVLMPPPALPAVAPALDPQPSSQAAHSIDALAAAAELELQQAGQVKVEDQALAPTQPPLLPPQQAAAVAQPDLLTQLQLLLQQQQGAAALQLQQAQQQQLLLVLLDQQRQEQARAAAQQGADANLLLTLLMQLMPHVQPAAPAPTQLAPQLAVLQPLPQQPLLTLLQQAAAALPLAPTASAPAAPLQHPFLEQLARSMQPAGPQALPAMSQTLASLLQSVPVPAAVNTSPQPPSAQAL